MPAGPKDRGASYGGGLLLGAQYCILPPQTSVNRDGKARNKGRCRGWAESESNVGKVEVYSKCLWPQRGVEAAFGRQPCWHGEFADCRACACQRPGYLWGYNLEQ